MGLFDTTQARHYRAMDSRKLKEGTIKRYKTGLLSSKWKDCHAVLFSDSTLSWYNEKGDSRPVESILLKDVVPYICVGQMTDRMPTRRPQLPQGHSVHHLVGIGMDPRAEKVHWFLFASDSDLESWFGEIVKTLPKPATPPEPIGGNVPTQPPPYSMPQPSNTNSYVPPPRYPAAPPPVGGYNPMPQQQPYGGYRPPPPVQAAAAAGGYGYGQAPAAGPTTVRFCIG
jgi:hypothetical protein